MNSTFGGAGGRGNNCSNGGAISGLRTPITVLNSLISHNNAIGCCANPVWSGAPGGGSGGAIYTDGTSYDLRRLNTYAPNGLPNNPHFRTYPGIFYIGSGNPTFTNSTIQ